MTTVALARGVVDNILSSPLLVPLPLRPDCQASSRSREFDSWPVPIAGKQAMASSSEVNAFVGLLRAARPVFRNPADKLAFAVHASLLFKGYWLVGVGDQATSFETGECFFVLAWLPFSLRPAAAPGERPWGVIQDVLSSPR